MPPRTCSAARIRSVARKRSATMPTKKGEIIAASAVVPAARPICSPEKCSVSPSHVPIVTYHAPHTKYCRNIIAESFTRTVVFIVLRSTFYVLRFKFSLQRLRPPRLHRRLGENHPREHVDGSLQPFVNRCEGILVLDAHHIIVPGKPQRTDDALPFELAVSPADTAEQP